MKLLIVSAGRRRQVQYEGHTITTGIFKEPVDGRVMLRDLGLEGDEQADLEAHGGIHKAAYAYPREHYETWSRELGRDDLRVPQFGENFTVEGMRESDIFVGDVLQIGGARVVVTQPRVPCFKLGIKMNDPAFLKPFLRSLRTGFYLRVLQEGEVGAGDPIERVARDPAGMSVADVCRLYYFDRDDREGARRALRIEALPPGWREGFARRLDPLGEAPHPA